MKKIIALLLFLLIALPVFGQDETSTPTDEPTALATEVVVATETETSFVTPTEIVATVTASDFVTPTPDETATPVVVTATNEPATPEPEATQIIIVVTQPGDDGGNDDNTDDASTSSTFANIGWVLFLLTLSALAFVVVTWIRELRKSAAAGDQNSKNLLTFVNATQDMLPINSLLSLIDNLDKRAKATPTPGEVDDKVLAQLRAYVYEALGKDLPPEAPTAPGTPAAG